MTGFFLFFALAVSAAFGMAYLIAPPRTEPKLPANVVRFPGGDQRRRA
jgi:hypothetical protein